METTYELSIENSTSAMHDARNSIASGLASFARYRHNQIVFDHAQGAYLWDIQGNRFIDCVCGHGPIFLGHSNRAVTDAVITATGRGLQFGGPHLPETELAEIVLSCLPWADKVAFMNTGSEAVHLALRVARSATKKTKILKFDGHYHGWIDPLFVNAPQVKPDAPRPQSDRTDSLSAGTLPQHPNVVGHEIFDDVIIAPWGDIDSFKSILGNFGDELAAVILEPFATNFGTFFPPEGYLEELCAVARSYGVLVIFDEIVSGFRLSLGGAAEILNVSPDIAVYGKAIASGMSISMIAGTSAVMKTIENGNVTTVGTFSGAPASVAGAIATLREIMHEGSSLYSRLDQLGLKLKIGLEDIGSELGLSIHVNQVGSLLQILIGDLSSFNTIEGVNESNKELVAKICEQMILFGVYMSRKGIVYLNSDHSDADIDEIIEKFRLAVSKVQASEAESNS